MTIKKTGRRFVLADSLPCYKPLSRCKVWMRGNLVFFPPSSAECNPDCLSVCQPCRAKLCNQISSCIIHASSFTLALFTCRANLCNPCYFPLIFFSYFSCSISECPFQLPFSHTFFISPLSTALLSFCVSIHLPTTSFASLYLFAFASPLPTILALFLSKELVSSVESDPPLHTTLSLSSFFSPLGPQWLLSEL